MLNYLLEENYITEPDDFVEDDKFDLVCWLNSTLQFKRNTECWYKKIDSFSSEKKSEADHSALRAYLWQWWFDYLTIVCGQHTSCSQLEREYSILKACLVKEFDIEDMGGCKSDT